MSSQQVAIVDNDRGPLIKIVAWIMMVAFIGTSIAKVVTKVFMAERYKPLRLDDVLVVTATMFAIGQVVAISFQVDAGLGRHQSTEWQDGGFGKAELAADILYVTVICLGRGASWHFQHGLCGKHLTYRHWMVRGLVIVDVIWAITSILVLGLQCPLPRVWLSTATCPNRATFWTVYGALNIALDSASAFLPIYLIKYIQMPADKKPPVKRVFLARMLASPLIILRIVLQYKAYFSDDFAYNDSDAAIVTEIHLGISLILSCVPFLKPVLDSLPNGILGGEDFYTEDDDHISEVPECVLASIRDVEPNDRRLTPRLWETEGNAIIVTSDDPRENAESGDDSKGFQISDCIQQMASTRSPGRRGLGLLGRRLSTCEEEV